MLNLAQQQFSRDGVSIVRGLFKDWIEPLRQGVDLNYLEPGEWFRDYSPQDDTAKFWADYCNWQRIPQFKEFIQKSSAAAVAQQLMNSETVRIFHEHVLVKSPNSNKITPWHHDAPYYPVHAQQTLSLWIPLDPVSIDSAIEFVAGSHLWGQDYIPQSFTGDYYEHKNSKEVRLPDIEAKRDAYTILAWDLELGDAIAFDYRTVHGAPGNRSTAHSRRAISFRWLGDDACYVDRGGKTSPAYPHLIDQLQTGDHLPEHDFPFVIR